VFKKYECIMQDGPADCGICSLLMIVKYYGGDVSKEYLRDLTNTTKNGVTAFSLLETGSKLGFEAKGVQGSVNDIDSGILPCIAHVVINDSYKHFVVIYKIDYKKKIITIADPAVGIVNMKIEDFVKISTDNYLLFVPNKPILVTDRNKVINNLIIKFLRENKSKIVSIVIFSLIYTLINIITSFNIQLIIENVIAFNNKNNLYTITCIMITLFIFKGIIDFFRIELLNYINHKMDYSLIKSTFKHIVSLPHLYYKNRTTGEVVSRINDLGDLREGFSRLFMAIFIDIVLLVFVLITLFSISVKLTFIALVVAIIHIIIGFSFNHYLNKMIKQVKENGARANSSMIEMIKGNDTIKGLNIERKANSVFLSKYSNFLKGSYKYNKIYNVEVLIKDFINAVGMIALVFFGALLVIEGNITIGELITYNSLIVYFIDPIKNVFEFDLLRRKMNIATRRLEELYDVGEEELRINEMYTGKKIKGFIKVKDLNYSYNAKDSVLANVNIDIDKGEKVVLYGTSGSGKSTLVKLIMKYINAKRDQLFIDGKDINDYHIQDIRENISYVSQNEMLLNDTLYNNIVVAEEKLSYDDFVKICRICKVDEIYNRDIRGANMLIEEDAANISGGERQRIILARALIRNSSIYILDESLNQVDVVNERNILENVFKAYNGKTFIVISHRSHNEDVFDKQIRITNGEEYV